MLQDEAVLYDTTPKLQERARQARDGNDESAQASAWASLSLEETEAAILTDTERQIGGAFVTLCARDFEKTDVVKGVSGNNFLHRHMGLVTAIGDALAAHCEDEQRAMLVTKHLWVQRSGGPKIDPAKLNELRGGVDGAHLNHAIRLAKTGIKI